MINSGIPDCNPCQILYRICQILSQTVIDYNLQSLKKQCVTSRPESELQNLKKHFTVWKFQPNNNVLSPESQTVKYPLYKERKRHTLTLCHSSFKKRGGYA